MTAEVLCMCVMSRLFFEARGPVVVVRFRGGVAAARVTGLRARRPAPLRRRELTPYIST